MIFCHTRKTVNWLVEKMRGEGHAVALLSGELSVEERLNVLDRLGAPATHIFDNFAFPGSGMVWKRS